MAILNQSGDYLKVDDAKEGDIITITSEGEWVENQKYTYDDGNKKQNFEMKADHNGTSKTINVNKFSRDEIIPVYGKDTASWVGRKLKVTIENYRSLGKKGFIFFPIKEAGGELGSGGDINSKEKAWDE